MALELSVALEELGLTGAESKTYLALLSLGETTTGPLIEKSGVASSKVYENLEKLALKGLVFYVLKNNVKYFAPANPAKLRFMLDTQERQVRERKKLLEKNLPALENRFKEIAEKQEAELIKGSQAIQNMYDYVLDYLKKGEEICVFGASLESRRWEPYFVEWNQRRIGKGIKMRIIYGAELKKWGKIRAKWLLTHVKYLPQDMQTPAWTSISRDYIFTIAVTPEPVGFLIKNKKVAESYQTYFEFVWKQAVK